MHNALCLFAAEIHKDNEKWWRDPRTGKTIEGNKGEKLFLMISEIVEAGEGERKNLMDDHLPHRKMAEVEMADVVIRMMDYIGRFGYDLDESLRGGYPLVVVIDKSLNGLVTFFANRFYNRAGNKGEQMLAMCQVIGQIAVFEASNRYREADQRKFVSDGLLKLLSLICDYCWCWGYDLEGAVKDKRAYNAKRDDHSDQARIAAGGKKW